MTEDKTLYDVFLYSGNGNDHFIRVDDEALFRLEADLDANTDENFGQYYCHDAEAVTGVRLDAVELFTVREAN